MSIIHFPLRSKRVEFDSECSTSGTLDAWNIEHMEAAEVFNSTRRTRKPITPFLNKKKPK
jgi:hypothetical protein